MNTTTMTKYIGAVVALAICSACGGALPLSLSKGQDDMAVAPSSAGLTVTYVGKTLSVNGRLVTAARANLGAPPRFATIAPSVLPGRKHEYIINDYGSYAAVFDYPTSTQQIGEISDVGGQGCSDVLYGYGKKTFWIVAGESQITEYATRNDKPIKTLSVSVGAPSSCAMDTSGDLAVGILYNPTGESGGGDIVIFKNATGTGTVMATPLCEEYFDGYDNHGNLFADGFTCSGFFALVELPKGSTKFETITTSNTVEFPGSVQWDGTYLTVTDQAAAAMYRYTVSGTTATLDGTVLLTGSSDCAQTWIAKAVVYCADADNEDGEVFNYPAGGSIVAVLGSALPLPLGTVAAEKR
jgi:hypothetical protein